MLTAHHYIDVDHVRRHQVALEFVCHLVLADAFKTQIYRFDPFNSSLNKLCGLAAETILSRSSNNSSNPCNSLTSHRPPTTSPRRATSRQGVLL